MAKAFRMFLQSIMKFWHISVMNEEYWALSPASDLTVLELSEDELLVASEIKHEMIKVVGYTEPLAVRLRRMSEARRNPTPSS